jgi:hypothetical protein
MNDIEIKYNRLNKTAKRELNDFIDFLLSKEETNNSMKNYKNKILNVSVWSDSDLKAFNENQKLFKQWNVQEW